MRAVIKREFERRAELRRELITAGWRLAMAIAIAVVVALVGAGIAIVGRFEHGALQGAAPDRAAATVTSEALVAKVASGWFESRGAS